MVMPLTDDAGALEDPSVVMAEIVGAPLSVGGRVGPCDSGGFSSTENDANAVICIDVIHHLTILVVLIAMF